MYTLTSGQYLGRNDDGVWFVTRGREIVAGGFPDQDLAEASRLAYQGLEDLADADRDGTADLTAAGRPDLETLLARDPHPARRIRLERAFSAAKLSAQPAAREAQCKRRDWARSAAGKKALKAEAKARAKAQLDEQTRQRAEAAAEAQRLEAEREEQALVAAYQTPASRERAGFGELAAVVEGLRVAFGIPVEIAVKGDESAWVEKRDRAWHDFADRLRMFCYGAAPGPLPDLEPLLRAFTPPPDTKTVLAFPLTCSLRQLAISSTGWAALVVDGGRLASWHDGVVEVLSVEELARRWHVPDVAAGFSRWLTAERSALLEQAEALDLDIDGAYIDLSLEVARNIRDEWR